MAQKKRRRLGRPLSQSRRREPELIRVNFRGNLIPMRESDVEEAIELIDSGEVPLTYRRANLRAINEAIERFGMPTMDIYHLLVLWYAFEVREGRGPEHLFRETRSVND